MTCSCYQAAYPGRVAICLYYRLESLLSTFPDSRSPLRTTYRSAGAMNATQLSEAMGLATIKNRQWTIQETSATEGKGLTNGFDWLVQAISAKVG